MTYKKEPFDDEEQVYDGPSKSALKREKLAQQELGKKIIDLPKGFYVRIPLSELMKDAIALYKRLKSNEAKRRQLQFIGKNMHSEDLEAIAAAFTQMDNENKLFRQHFQKLEIIRDNLVEQGDKALADLMIEHPHLNRQEIRQLIRQANKEVAQQKPSSAKRKLFLYLQRHIEVKA